ncbi:hypothetical protein Cs7R123_44260 [Catellatospora sp. TT07R-123]|uniref:ankyrin repeat domain-containing protein n=1 Tax=Catellatospora sp. TT07R-123 TaxID=2733863 RepID=UPI001B2DF5FD|nr:ankyrin repeat domain-containing protein [Catellatospora sp. TT07R-123]GHJ47084.1 hypothetical protein Cs7R123_44260 [Catellatospora sp. TT07R-123]
MIVGTDDQDDYLTEQWVSRAVREGDASVLERALVEAAGRDHVQVVEMLLDAGVPVGSRLRGIVPELSSSALMYAVCDGAAGTVELLIRRGGLAAEPQDSPPSLPRIALASCITGSGAHLATLSTLLAHSAPLAPGEEPLLVTAVQEGAPPVVLRELLRHGASPDEHRSDGTPALVMAARRGDAAAVDVLLQAGADADAADRHGRTALMYAVERDEQQVVAVLRLAGADVHRAAADGATAVTLSKGWTWQTAKDLLGVVTINLPLAARRTAMLLQPQRLRVQGDPGGFELWALMIEHALGVDDDEPLYRVLKDPVAADVLAARLREGHRPGRYGAWNVLALSAAELHIVTSAMFVCEHRSPGPLPGGLDRARVRDLRDDLRRMYQKEDLR